KERDTGSEQDRPARRPVVVSSGHQLLFEVPVVRKPLLVHDGEAVSTRRQSLGSKSMMRLRSNSDRSDGSGRGEARNTAASIDCTTAASPLAAVTRALTTSPLGI